MNLHDIQLLIYSDNCGIEIIDQVPAEGTIVNYDFETFFTIIDSSGNSKVINQSIIFLYPM